MGLLSENDETQSLIKKRKVTWYQKLSKCPYIAVLFGILLLTFIYIIYHVLIRNGPESKETPKVAERTFIVDHERNEFLKDGQVFRYVSGSLHYFRVPKPYWKDRIKKMKAAGLNAVSTYVEWSLHEPYPGVYNFEDNADLEYFLKLVQDEGMYLLLRPGPFISAERDFGGFPFWLLNVVPKNGLRTNDPSYKYYIAKWFDILMPKIVPFLYGNGGNIIMVQVENEYGFYYACDHQYMIWLRDLYKSYIKSKALLYTTDMCGDSYFKCGTVADVYATVDFGPWNTDVNQCFQHMKEFQNGGPLVNSEYYTGWGYYWGSPLQFISSDIFLSAMKEMLALNVSFNIYPFHGGTNFGFTTGSAKKSNEHFKPTKTSYDFTAPLNEAGDPTEKYFKIQKLLKETNFLVSNDISPVPAPKGYYGTLKMQHLVSIFEKVTQRIKPVESDVP
ncbi:beta-galactosidase, partial [Acyrthosiphon pisum]|uniref:Glycoside hydrolase 35 catalytic domain-containing protein n=1 Tax=Acyrthosiphon pisum TaxID=7029 RepID=A0A8R2JS16_ACYPI